MAFDPEKDKTVATWRHKDGLEVSLHRYNEGEIKLQIGPRYYENKAGEEKRAKAGRLTIVETHWLSAITPEIEAAAEKG